MENTEQIVRKALQDFIDTTRLHGYVVTINNPPLLPLAMGHYELVASIRVSRSNRNGDAVLEHVPFRIQETDPE
jgi:hypothetical protein